MFLKATVVIWALGLIGLMLNVPSSAVAVVLGFIMSIALIAARELASQGSENKLVLFLTR